MYKNKKEFRKFLKTWITIKILKSGKIFSCFAFANSSPYSDMSHVALVSLSRHHTTPSPLLKIYIVYLRSNREKNKA